jgi:4-hydroxybenzoate polyprenyltransferase
MRQVRTYLAERFPPALTALMAVSFGLFCGAVFARDTRWQTQWWLAVALLAVLFLALLLRYRVTDEWKDFAHDNAAYPDRPLQRGAITVRALVVLGIVALLVELAAATGIRGPIGLLAYLPVLALTLLTAVEFFARKALQRRFTLAFVLHELVYLPLFAWAAFALGAPVEPRVLAGVVAGAALFVSVEIVRKFELRRDPAGAVVPDTYPAVWGRGAAIVVLVILVLVAGALAWAAGASMLSPAVAVVAAAVIVVGRKRDAVVIAAGGAHLPLQALAVSL